MYFLFGQRGLIGRRFSAAIVAMAVSVLLGGSAAIAQQDLSALMNDARNSFKPVTEQQVDAARADLKKQMQKSSDSLSHRLRTASVGCDT